MTAATVNGHANRLPPGQWVELQNGAKLRKPIVPQESEVPVSSVIKTVQYELRHQLIRIEGTSPLVTHAWSEKAIRMIQDKQAGSATKGREKRNPDAEYKAAFYRKADGSYAVPLLGIKAAVVTAATSLGKQIPKTLIRQAFHVLDPDRDGLVALHYPKEAPPYMSTDMVRVGMGVADVRYRPKFDKWGVEVTLWYNANALSLEQIVNLFNLAGFGVGVCEHRPEKDGAWGMFQVVNDFSWLKKAKSKAGKPRRGVAS